MTKSRSQIQFGNIPLERVVSTNHFLFAGTTGSGKTSLLRLLLQSGIREIGTGVDSRLLINDPKQDVYPYLRAMAPDAEIVITNPFDSRSSAWDLVADINSPQVAIEFAYTMIPQVNQAQPFFDDASRHLIYGVVLSFLLSGDIWTLADLIRVSSSRRLLRAILRRHPETRDIADLYLNEPRLTANILATLATKLLPFGPMAAAWEHATSRVSLSQWSKSEMILILGNSEVSRTPMQVLNRCMFKRACDITLDEEESRDRRNWFAIDELSDAGRLDGLVSLAKKGRSKGACLAVALQSVAGLRDTQLYGPYFTEEILAQFGHKFIGRMECSSSAEWASLLVGDLEVTQHSYSQTSGGQHSSSTTTTQKGIRRATLPGEILDFSPCNIENGLTGLFFIPSVGTFKDTLDGEQLFLHDLIEPTDDPAFVARPVEHQFLRPWSTERAELFGMADKMKPAQKASTKKKPVESPDPLEDLFS